MADPKTRPLALWLGRNADPILRGAADLAPFTAAAIAYRSLDHHAKALEEARARGLAIYPDLECWREQFGAEHPSHPLDGLAWSKRAYDPSKERISEELAEEIAELQVEVLVQADADWFASPGHVVEEGHSLAIGRRNELRQAHAFSAVVRSRGTRAVDLESGRRPRRVLATIAIKPARLQHTVAREIPAAYAEVDCDAYVLRAWRFSRSRSQYLVLRKIALDLQARTGRPCIIEGLGHLAYGTLRNEVAGAVVGYERGTLDPFATAELARKNAQIEKETGEKPKIKRSVVPYARTILKGLAAGADFHERRLVILRDLNCGCGWHDRDGDVQGLISQLSHNLASVREELIEAITEDNIDVFAKRLRKVEATRRLAGLGKGLESGWRAVLEPHRPADEVRPRNAGGF